MADNTLIQTPPITTTDIPRTPLSKSDISEPYTNLAAGLDKLGEGVNDMAVPMAEREGREAVRTDDQGNVVVDRAPLILGPAGTAYSRSVQMTTLAQIQPKIDKDLLDLRMNNRFDPNGYQTASQAYIKNLGSRFAATPELSNAIQQTAQQTFVHNYRTVLTETDQNQTSQSLEAYQSRIADLNAQTTALARQGGTGTPEYQQASAARATLWNEIGADRRYGISPENIQAQINKAYANDQVQAIIGDAQRQFQTRDNKGAAQEFLRARMWDPNLNLTPQQREYGISEGLRNLDIVDATTKELLGDNRSMVSNYVTSLKRLGNAGFDQGRFDDMVRKSESLGDFKSVADLAAAQSFLPLWDALKGMPSSQAAQTMQQLTAGVVPSGRFDDIITREATRAGLDPDTVKRIIHIESGGRPNAQTGSYKGLMQLSDAEFAKYGPAGVPDAHGPSGNVFDPEANIIAGVNSLADKSAKFAASHGGRAPTATELYMMHQQGEAGAANHFANPDRPAWQNMLNTAEGRQKGEGWAKAAIWGNIPSDMRRQFPGGVDSVTSRDFVNVWQQKVEGAPIGGSHVDIFADSPTGRLFQSTINDYRTRVGSVAEKMQEVLHQKVEAGDGVSGDDVKAFTQAAVASGKEDLLEKAAPDLKVLDVRAGIAPGTSSDVIKAQIEAMKASGVSDPATYHALTTLGQVTQLSSENLQKNPLAEGGHRNYFPPINPIDMSNPQQMVQEFADRSRKAGILKQMEPNYPGGGVNILGEDEGRRLAGVMTQPGAGDTARAVLTGLQTSLKPPEYAATMASEPIKNAVIGMAGSGDPVKMGAAMTAMSALYQRDPNAFRQAYGEQASTMFHAWEAMRNQLTDAEIAQRINQANTPQAQQAMKLIEEKANSELRAGWVWSGWGGHGEQQVTANPQAVANQVAGSFFQRNLPFFFGNVSLPDQRQSAIMATDFSNTYRELRKYGAEPDAAAAQALARLQETWKVSPTNGGRIMQNAPEAQTFNGKPYYPTVNDSYQWMTDQRDAVIDAKYGRTRAPAVAGELPGASTAGDVWTPNARFRGLVADNQTEAERARGDFTQPPSYLMMVTTKNGQDEMLSGPDGMPVRVRFNPAVAQAMALPAFQAGVDYWRRTGALIDAIAGSASLPGTAGTGANVLIPSPEQQRADELGSLDRREGALRALKGRGWGGLFVDQQLGAIRDRRRALGGNIEEGPGFSLAPVPADAP